MTHDRSVVVSTSEELPPQNESSWLAASHQSFISRRKETETTDIDDFRDRYRFGDKLTDRAERLGFSTLGISSRRELSGFRDYTLHMVDLEHRVLLDYNLRIGDSVAWPCLRTHFTDGTTVAVEPERFLPNVNGADRVFPKTGSLRSNYERLQKAVDYRADTHEASVITVNSFERSVELLEHYDLTEAPRKKLTANLNRIFLPILVLLPIVPIFIP